MATTENKKKPILHKPPSAADFLHVKESTLAVWRCSGRYDLPYIKMGSNILYDEQDLLAFLEKRKKV